jgi:carbon storage regulator
MLVLSRKRSEGIVIGKDVRITVVKIERNTVRLGIQAPASIPILREELRARALRTVDSAAELVASNGAAACQNATPPPPSAPPPLPGIGPPPRPSSSW